MITCGQLVYAWAGEGSKRGYQVIAASNDIARDDLNYAALNALPTSFSTGDFQSSIRAYILPSKKYAISYVAPAGKDLLGRPGTYYGHTLTLKRETFSKEGISLADLFDSFVKDERSISYLIESFKGNLVPLPGINVELRKSRDSAASVFKSLPPLTAILQHLFKIGENIVIGVEKDMTDAKEFNIVDSIFSLIPNDLLPLTFSTFSNSYNSDFSIFRIIFVPMKRVRSNTFNPSQYLVIDPSGSYNPYSAQDFSPQIQKLANYLLKDEKDLVSAIYSKYESYGYAVNPHTRIQYAVKEFEIERNPNLNSVFRLYERPLDSEMQRKYKMKLIELAKIMDNLKPLGEHFNSLVAGSVDQTQFDRNFREASEMMIGTGDKNSIRQFLSKSFETARTKRFALDYQSVFNLYTGNKEEIAKTAIGEFILEVPGVLDEWLKYSVKKGSFLAYGGISSILEMVNDRKVARKMVETVFFKIDERYELSSCLEFLKDYLNSDRFELDSGFEIYKSLLKKAKSSPSSKEREEVVSLSSVFVQRGKKESDVSKLVDKVK